VSWDDSQRFLHALNQRVPGLDLRLPSEAQWEYACRAGSTSPWCFDGDETGLGEYAWHSANAGRETHPVGQKRPNAWGLYDCHGNVWEWVQDTWHESYEGSPDDGSPWESSQADANRVIRGGSWYDYARFCRSAYRDRRLPAYRLDFLGFRPARVELREPGSGPGREERSDRPRLGPARGSGSGGAEAGAHRGASAREGQHQSGAQPATLAPAGTTLRLHADEGSGIALPEAPALVLRTDRDELTLRRLPKPGWADAMGRDRFGLWADIRIESTRAAAVIQRLRWIPPGRFLMGSPNGEPGRGRAEGPRHEVVIGQGYWLFDTPCTQALWEAVLGEHESSFRDPRRPVEKVSGDDARRFADALQARLAALDDDGGRVVLPSEAQWEYACRAGTETALYTGPIEIRGDIQQSMDAPALDPIAWYGGNSGADYVLEVGEDSTTGWWEGKQKQYPHSKAGTRRVRQKQPNAWGLYDMLGNVWEWTEDHWHDSYDGAPTDGSAWINSDRDAGAGRVIRGGSWDGVALLCRSASRYGVVPDDRDDYLGFRPARVQL
jgi:formylglycine-generating enzyme required for sulfatase activity